jgi:hypothetical protein
MALAKAAFLHVCKQKAALSTDAWTFQCRQSEFREEWVAQEEDQHDAQYGDVFYTGPMHADFIRAAVSRTVLPQKRATAAPARTAASPYAQPSYKAQDRHHRRDKRVKHLLHVKDFYCRDRRQLAVGDE